MMRGRLLGGTLVVLAVISLIAVVCWSRASDETARVVSGAAAAEPAGTDPGTPLPGTVTPTGPAPVTPDPAAAAPTPVRGWVATPAPAPATGGRDQPSAAGASAGGAAGARLRIPSLAVDARLEPAAIREGVFQVPPDPAVVGVHRGDAGELPVIPRAGPGTTLLSGHVTSGRTRGALWPLHRLAPGAEIQTSDGAGRTIRWRATSLRTVPADELPAGLLDRAGPTRLVVVTCAGEVETVDGHRRYRDNLLVEATPMN